MSIKGLSVFYLNPNTRPRSSMHNFIELLLFVIVVIGVVYLWGC